LENNKRKKIKSACGFCEMASFVLAALESVLPHIVLHHMSSALDGEKDC